MALLPGTELRAQVERHGFDIIRTRREFGRLIMRELTRHGVARPRRGAAAHHYIPFVRGQRDSLGRRVELAYKLEGDIDDGSPDNEGQRVRRTGLIMLRAIVATFTRPVIDRYAAIRFVLKNEHGTFRTAWMGGPHHRGRITRRRLVEELTNLEAKSQGEDEEYDPEEDGIEVDTGTSDDVEFYMELELAPFETIAQAVEEVELEVEPPPERDDDEEEPQDFVSRFLRSVHTAQEDPALRRAVERAATDRPLRFTRRGGEVSRFLREALGELRRTGRRTTRAARLRNARTTRSGRRFGGLASTQAYEQLKARIIDTSWIKKSHYAVQIQNVHDELCLPRALSLAMAHYNRKTQPLVFTRLYKHRFRERYRTEAAQDLMQQFPHIPIPVPLGDLAELAEGMGYNVVVYNPFMELLFHGNRDLPALYLIANEQQGHIEAVVTDIQKLTQFITRDTEQYLRDLEEGSQVSVADGRKSRRNKRRKAGTKFRTSRTYGFCNGCYTWTTGAFHRCRRMCAHPQCDYHHPQMSPAPGVATVNCDDCYRSLPVPCYEVHKLRGACERTWWCHYCDQALLRVTHNPATHQCNTPVCRYCFQEHPREFQCFLPILKPMTDKARQPKFLYLDFETKTNSEQEHVVTYAGLMSDEEHSYWEFTKLDDCMAFLLQEQYHHHTVVAHNMAGYDGHFIFHWLLTKGYRVDTIVREGTRLVQFRCRSHDLMFRDSLRQLPMALASFVKAFSLPARYNKPHFPYKLYNECWDNYQGEFPDVLWYLDDFRQTPAQQQKLRDWHTKEKLRRKTEVTEGKRAVEFDLVEECRDYCYHDVLLLKAGLTKFRAMFQQLTQVDPMESITLASAVMKAYRTSFMPEDSITIMPFKMQKFLRSGYFGGLTECLVPLDITYQGQYEYIDVCSMYPWAMFTQQFPFGQAQWLSPESLEKHPLEWVQCLQNDEVFGMLEVDIDPPRDLETFPQLFLPPLPERCRRQGQSQKLEFNCYPKRNQVYTTPELKYALACGYELKAVHQGVVWHQTTTELFRHYISMFFYLKTVSAGYGVLKGFPSIQQLEYIKEFYYRFKFKDTPLDQKIVQQLLSLLKQRFEEWHVSDGASTLYMTQYQNILEAMGAHNSWEGLIPLNGQLWLYTACLMQNPQPALKTVSKLMLNSLYGKFGQRSNFDQTILVGDRAELFMHLTAPDTEVTNIIHHTPDGTNAELRFKYRELHEAQTKLRNFCHVAIAAFTTAYGRLKLLKMVHQLGRERVLYMDTDSIIYKVLPQHPLQLRENHFLGGWENEYPQANQGLRHRFVSTGPKVYGYELLEGPPVLHIKGFKYCQSSTGLFQLASLQNALLATPEQPAEIKQELSRFQSNRNHQIFTTQQHRTYAACFTKRCVSRVIYNELGDAERVETQPHGSRWCCHGPEDPITETESRYPVYFNETQ